MRRALLPVAFLLICAGVRARPAPAAVNLTAGEHAITLTWPAGSKLGVQKIVLSNDLNSR